MQLASSSVQLKSEQIKICKTQNKQEMFCVTCWIVSGSDFKFTFADISFAKAPNIYFIKRSCRQKDCRHILCLETASCLEMYTDKHNCLLCWFYWFKQGYWTGQLIMRNLMKDPGSITSTRFVVLLYSEPTADAQMSFFKSNDETTGLSH